MRINLKSALFSVPIAHRGLWGADITENSAFAYENAAANAYPVEIDVYASRDGELFCFHDKSLERMTGAKGLIYEKTADELKSLDLIGGGKIPTLKETLEIAEGRIPLLIEIKNQPDKRIVERTVAALKDYKGEFAVQSFNPLYIAKVKKLAPEIIRGVLATSDEEDLKGENSITRFIVKNLALNFIAKPDFISYKHTGLPLKKSKIKNKALLCWTVTSQAEYERVKPMCDNIIFENFIPE